MPRRATKIVATLGPATEAPEVLDALLEAGVDCVRINCSHGTTDELRSRTEAARAAAARAGRPLAVLFDLQGPKLRLSAQTAEREVAEGQTVRFRGARREGETGPDRGDEGPTDAGDGTGGQGDADGSSGGPGAGDGQGADGEDLVVDYPDLLELVTEDSQVVIGDGMPRFAVQEVAEDHLVARALTAGPLLARKGVNVTHARPTLPALTDKDLGDLALAAELDADVVALSFVRSARDMRDLRERLDEHASRARTVAKIEKVEAIEHLDEILEVSDGVMVARGDYGVEAGVAQVPLMQKRVIQRATAVGKVVITATQMLESMIEAAEPTRAEVADVANAVIDGTSAVMLSAETGVGEHPVAAVRAMAEIARAAEGAPVIHGRATEPEPGSLPAATVLQSAVRLAESLGAAAIVVPTTSGGGPRTCAMYRPSLPILAMCHDERVARQLMLDWGVHPVATVPAEGTDELIETCLRHARDAGGVPSGASVVVTAGRRTGAAGGTSLVLLREVP